MQEYHATMPWLALAFTKRQERAAASQRFGIQGIPALVLLEGGKVINRNARGAVLQDHPMGTGFPWAGQEDAAPGCAAPACVPVAHATWACTGTCSRPCIVKFYVDKESHNFGFHCVCRRGDGGLRSWLLMAALIALYFLLRYYFKVI
jgi:hypothetical protein